MKIGRIDMREEDKDGGRYGWTRWNVEKWEGIKEYKTRGDC